MEDKCLLASFNLAKSSEHKPDVSFSHKETSMILPFSDLIVIKGSQYAEHIPRLCKHTPRILHNFQHGAQCIAHSVESSHLFFFQILNPLLELLKTVATGKEGNTGYEQKTGLTIVAVPYIQ